MNASYHNNNTTQGVPKDRRNSKNSNSGPQKKLLKTADHLIEKDQAANKNEKLSITSWMCGGGGVASTATTAVLSPYRKPEYNEVNNTDLEVDLT